MELVPISKVKANPANPRTIKDVKFARLVESLKNFPEMANVRPIIVNTDMVALGGNMRLKAMKEAGWKQAPVEIVDWPEEKQREFIIKDNIGYGDWDWQLIAAEWPEVGKWDLEVPEFDAIDEKEQKDLSGELKETFEVIISCKDEKTQEQIYNKLIAEGYECRVLTL
jgi:ParB-like chromosome segregation protein Spo0J